MGQLVAQHVHAGALIQQDVGALGHRLNPQLLGMWPRLMRMLEKSAPKPGSNFSRSWGDMGWGAPAAEMEQLAPGGRLLLDGRRGALRGFRLFR